VRASAGAGLDAAEEGLAQVVDSPVTMACFSLRPRATAAGGRPRRRRRMRATAAGA